VARRVTVVSLRESFFFLSSSDILSSSFTDSCVFILFSLVQTDVFPVVPALSMPTTCVSSCDKFMIIYKSSGGPSSFLSHPPHCHGSDSIDVVQAVWAIIRRYTAGVVREELGR
jgi:hypothetical protein